uniref:Uncharacterized protein n=1 Tax=Amphimedon queenslandica TaxID=400682 RepID=A0A1X7U049_AMPQE
MRGREKDRAETTAWFPGPKRTQPPFHSVFLMAVAMTWEQFLCGSANPLPAKRSLELEPGGPPAEECSTPPRFGGIGSDSHKETAWKESNPIPALNENVLPVEVSPEFKL